MYECGGSSRRLKFSASRCRGDAGGVERDKGYFPQYKVGLGDDAISLPNS